MQGMYYRWWIGGELWGLEEVKRLRAGKLECKVLDGIWPRLGST
jgi:hypothetical protein